MARFGAGESRVLVATTVIEVGVDVPTANIIVIEHAERFGLSQLHQLRGRVGRGSAQAFCILLHNAAPEDEAARARLKVLRETNDGFKIAEVDLQMRGAGDLGGSRQSGEADYSVLDLGRHGAMMKQAVEYAAGRPGTAFDRRAKSLLALFQ